jgi:hypothetical protein
VDWNRDGHLDILSGCYWTEGAQAGHIYILYGEGGLSFSPAEPLLNEEGKPLENILISKEDYESGDGGDRITEAICTHQFAVDLDGDGDLDIVNGCFANSFYYYKNNGTREDPKLSATAILLPIKSPDYHAAPHLVDWDKDGDFDLLTGGGSGGAYLSINEGSRSEPKWSEFRQIIPKSDLHEQTLVSGVEIRPGPSTRVWAYDFNGDGWPDLLVGDSTTLISPAEGLTKEEFDEKEKAHREKIAEYSARYQESYQKLNAAMGALKEGETLDKEIENEFNSARDEYTSVFPARSEWCQEQRTGHVWVYLRKPPRPPVSKTLRTME